MPDASATPDLEMPSGDMAPAPLTVTPPTANVLTCSSLQLQESGGSGSGTWSVTPTGEGTVDSSGDYTAPTTAPANASVSVSFMSGTQTASAALQVATAFIGTPVELALNGDTNLGNVPLNHQMTAAGSQVAVGILAQDSLSVQVFSSSDSGRSFGAATSYHTGDTTCATVALDAGNPKTVYLAYLAGHGDSTGNTGGTVRLAVSTDGAKTFPVEYLIADSLNGIPNMICPDVISPSPGHVVVFGAVQGDAGSPAHLGTFVSSMSGQGIGPVVVQGQVPSQQPTDGSVYYAPSDTNGSTTQSTNIVHINGGGYGPHSGSNGAGGVCTAYQYYGGNNPDTTLVQCSNDGGATWTAPATLGAPTASANIHPTVAISPNGKNVAVAWIQTASNNDEVFLALSGDGGKTFATPIQYPHNDVADNFGASDPDVGWESDGILWVSMTIDAGNTPTIFVDKTCDGGKSWSGAVQAAALVGTSLCKTSKGMIVAGDDTNTPSLAVIALDAP